MRRTPDDALAESVPKTDPRYLNPRFQGEHVTAFERCVQPFWPLPYRPKHPRIVFGHRVRGRWDRHRWERDENVTPIYGRD